MSAPAYDAVVDVDDSSDGDLDRTDLQDDLEFHPSNFENETRGRKPGSSPFLPPPVTAGGPSGSSSSSTARGGGNFWSLSFYSQFFDVDTTAVLSRCWAALYSRQNFLDVLDGNPDLYGPVWIATTVVLILFLGGTISDYMTKEHGQPFAYNFTLLSGAAGLIYGYTLFIPAGLFLALRWCGSDAANLLECWALYGYANLIWIPVALISWSPINILNWVFVGVGCAVSLTFLTRSLVPIFRAAEKKAGQALIVAVVALHLALALTIKFLFFAHTSPLHGPEGSD